MVRGNIVEDGLPVVFGFTVGFFLFIWSLVVMGDGVCVVGS